VLILPLFSFKDVSSVCSCLVCFRFVFLSEWVRLSNNVSLTHTQFFIRFETAVTSPRFKLSICTYNYPSFFSPPPLPLIIIFIILFLSPLSSTLSFIFIPLFVFFNNITSGHSAEFYLKARQRRAMMICQARGLAFVPAPSPSPKGK
jgi:hypothetical protein